MTLGSRWLPRIYSRRRSETKSSGRAPWGVGLCVVRVLDVPVNALRAETPPLKARFGLGLRSHRVGHLRRFRVRGI